MKKIISYTFDWKKFDNPDKEEGWSIPNYADGPWWAWFGHFTTMHIYVLFLDLNQWFENFLCEHTKCTTSGRSDTGLIEKRCNRCGKVISKN
jgi:hypothetical protein